MCEGVYEDVCALDCVVRPKRFDSKCVILVIERVHERVSGIDLS